MDFERIDVNGWIYEYMTAATPEFHEDVRVILHVEIDRFEHSAEVVKVLIADGDGNEIEIGLEEIILKKTRHLYDAIDRVEAYALSDTAQDIDDYSEIELERDQWGEC